jgi:murein DD-endopeptidase MepM/ murein hydrolase activator NlpD
MFARREGDRQPRGDGAGSKRFVMPERTPAVAFGPGEVVRAGPSPTGGLVVIDHGRGIRSAYAHLRSVDVHVGQLVNAGHALGIIGDNPLDHDPAHLHFSVTVNGRDTNPRPLLAGAAVLG